ncbi:hypothetical protein GOP47_0023576 [Adiantum capillus-veneris]|uniref:Amino acid transporter transmembrane domain-containing protein n=1 Tax=Adiantum capillus-veneris TaxID=13818 RepID=A0A9D4U3R5_ADICA|nr:hypothetical protein GOP47_0023576 [Adiantum capillus-veneris]
MSRIMDTVEEGPEEDLSFQAHDHSDMDMPAGERELVSVPVTPKRVTPPLTPPSHSPTHPASATSPVVPLAVASAGYTGPSSSSLATTPHFSHVQFPQSASHTPTGGATRPSSSYTSPAVPRSPLITSAGAGSKTPRTPWTPRFLSPIGTPVVKAMTNMKSYLEDVGHFTKLNPQDAWLPITESRTGNAYYAAFHNLNAGIGFQGLLLPFAMFSLGWTWGLISLVIAYIWQLYTMWILIRLHEATPGVRYSRYVQLAQAAFGERLGFWLATPPNINLTAGTATTLLIVGGSTLKLFYKIVCGPDCGASPLTTIEWYLVFAMLSIVLAQLPNLNSIVGLSLIGAVTAITYCTMLWILSVSRARPPGVSYNFEEGKSTVAQTFTILNALGIVAFSFRGHNLAMEIQATMPSTMKHPAYVPMWRGAKVANAIVAVCYFPIAVAGYWAYGSMMLSSGILFSVYAFHQEDISRPLMGLLFMLVVIHCLSSFQIYSFSIFDNFEAGYTAKRNRPISKPVRVIFRIFYVFTNFLIGVAFPWLASLTGLLGGLSSAPVTFAYPCFMWLAIKKPKRYSFSWYLNWTLGLLGMAMAAAVTAGGIWSIVDSGLKLHFFKAS